MKINHKIQHSAQFGRRCSGTDLESSGVTRLTTELNGRPMSENHAVQNQMLWDLEIARQKALEIESMIADLTETAESLEREIANAEQEAGISDPKDMAYPSCAVAFRARLENVRRSLQSLHAEQEVAKTTLQSAPGGQDQAAL